MSGAGSKGKWRWLKHVAWVFCVTAALAIGAVVVFFGSGAGNPLLRRVMIHRLESITGGKVEARSISIRWLSLRATIKGLVIHGKEPQGTEPLFSAEEIEAGLRIDSYWGRRISLSDLAVKQPHVHIRVNRDGSSNVPSPPHSTSGKPLRETLLDLRTRHVQLDDGWILYNDVKKPLAIEGDEMRLVLDAGSSGNEMTYLGTLDWKDFQIALGRDVPVKMSVSTRFTIRHEGMVIEQAQVEAGKSRFDVHAEMVNFADPSWKYKARGWINFLDFRQTLRSPHTPEGKVEVSAEGAVAGGKVEGTGFFVASGVNLKYDIFHAMGLGGRGTFRMDNQGVNIPDLNAPVFGGTLRGRVALRFTGMQFRAETHLEGIRVGQVLEAAEHRGFPIGELHWDSVMNGDTVETWTGAFKHFEVAGSSEWVAPKDMASENAPITASWKMRYENDVEKISIESAKFEAPTSRIQASGILAKRGSNLDVKFETGALERYADFINAIRGIPAGSADAKRIEGSAKWEGNVTGSWKSPAFSGHGRGEKLVYGNTTLDFAEGDLSYAASGLAITRGHAQQGLMRADVEGEMALSDWSFLPDDTWSADVNLEKVPIASVQSFLQKSYPVEGVLTGQFHGRGTRAEPLLTGLFDLADGKAYGVTFDHLRGQLNIADGEIRVSNAELRVFPPGRENGRGAGIVTGSVAYRLADQNISAELVGAGLPLENFERLQMPRFPVAGQLTFHIKASGLARAPSGEGTFRVVDFRVGQQVIGSFEGNLTSDGNEAKFALSSAMSNGSISGGYSIGLRDPYPMRGKVTIQNIKLDPFLETALHLPHFTGHGTADGEISVEGDLAHADSLVMDANFTRLILDYANVQLQNEGPIHLRSSSAEFNLEPSTLKGAQTNLRIGGNVRFTGRRTVNLDLNGAADLGLLSGYIPNMEARGPAQINASFEGTLDRPRITGRVHIDNASVRATDTPIGLSAIKGDLIFDATRLYFEKVTAEEGGGRLELTGSVNYADRPLRYDVSVRTDRVRIRYPEGMSWLAGGTLRLTGTPEAGLLSGKVTVERVTLSEGLEVAGALVSAKEGIAGPSTNSSFLRNLQFDVEAVSTPDARMEWPSAELETDANLRVRGTWEHPILLGHIHVLSGDLAFRGNRYRVSRGDLNFANPFQLNPDINVEASTTIQQYEITLNFSGPANKLTLSYRSDPPLPSNDIITLLALGQTTSEAELRGGGTGAAQSSSAGASAILSEAISSQVGGRLERLFGITKLRVDPGLTGVGATGSEQNAAARVTVQQQIARDLTITYVSNVSSTQQQVIQVEYNVNRNVSIVALRDYNGTFGIDIKIKKRFP